MHGRSRGTSWTDGERTRRCTLAPSVVVVIDPGALDGRTLLGDGTGRPIGWADGSDLARMTAVAAGSTVPVDAVGDVTPLVDLVLVVQARMLAGVGRRWADAVPAHQSAGSARDAAAPGRGGRHR